MRNANWFIFIAILLVSCLDDPECYNLENDVIGFTYKVMGSGANDNLAFTGITVNEIEAIFNENFSGSTFTIPLDYLHEGMTMYFQGLDDMVTLSYNVQPQFVSKDCGPRFVLSGLNVVDHTFDSMRVINPTPGGNAQARNIEIYRCPVIQNTVINFYQLYSPGRQSQQTNFRFTGITTEFDQVNQYPETASRNTVTLPVNLQDTLTKFIFNDGITNRELLLDYELMTHARYRPCGKQTFVRRITVSNHTFDSVSVARNANGLLQDSITDPPSVNINIYRCPITNLVQFAFKRPATSGTGTVNNPVSLVSITTDYSGNTYYRNQSNVSLVELPLNPDSDTTTFYFNYSDRTDTIQVVYTRRDHTVFNTCGSQKVFSRLREAVDLPNVRVLPADSVTYPAVPNFEILP